MIINQRNQAYKNLTLGNSNVGFNMNGCTTSAIYEGWQEITGRYMDLEKFMTYLKYTTPQEYPDLKAGMIIWNQCDWFHLGIKFLERVPIAPTQNEIEQHQTSDNRFMVLELNHGRHWVLLARWSLVWFVLVQDSWRDSVTAENGIYRPIKKNIITGFAKFRTL